MTHDSPHGDHALDARGRAADADAAFVNPASGLANDYLNLFNEVVMIIEQLPDMPELFEELLAWRPVTYRDYFEKSALASKATALENYARLDPAFRSEFENLVAELDRVAVGSVVALRRIYKKADAAQPGELEEACARHGVSLRALLERAGHLVTHRDAALAKAS
jgi:hypothetical protein